MKFLTQRLQVRPWQPERDGPGALAIYGDPEVTRWLDQAADASLAATVARLRRYQARSWGGLGCWAVVEREPQRLIGNVLLVPLPGVEGTGIGKIEIGWHFRRDRWGQGFATEAAQALMHHGFHRLKLPQIWAVTLPDNHRSVAVMERLGMTRYGLSRDYYGGRELLLYGRELGVEGKRELEGEA